MRFNNNHPLGMGFPPFFANNGKGIDILYWNLYYSYPEFKKQLATDDFKTKFYAMLRGLYIEGNKFGSVAYTDILFSGIDLYFSQKDGKETRKINNLLKDFFADISIYNYGSKPGYSFELSSNIKNELIKKLNIKVGERNGL